MLYAAPMFAYDEATLSEDALTAIWDMLAGQPQPTTGEGLYLDYCAACHGEDGQGGPTTRPIVNEAGEISQFVRSGHELGNFAERREFMPQWSTDELSDAEVQLITQYVESL
jgi:mono/diheme cytochrome c family protein